MYLVRVKTRRGTGRAIVQRSNETFETIQKARVFIEESIYRQEALCFRSWGLVLPVKKEIKNGVSVEFKPAITLYKPLTQVYTIETI